MLVIQWRANAIRFFIKVVNYCLLSRKKYSSLAGAAFCRLFLLNKNIECMERVIDRFDKYILQNGLNDNKVTVATRISTGVIGKSRRVGRDMSRGLMEIMLRYYTDLSPEWLLSGKGEMIIAKENKKPKTIVVEKQTSISDIERENEFLRKTIELKDELRRQDKELMEYLKEKIKRLESNAKIC